VCKEDESEARGVSPEEGSRGGKQQEPFTNLSCLLLADVEDSAFFTDAEPLPPCSCLPA